MVVVGGGDKGHNGHPLLMVVRVDQSQAEALPTIQGLKSLVSNLPVHYYLCFVLGGSFQFNCFHVDFNTIIS